MAGLICYNEKKRKVGGDERKKSRLMLTRTGCKSAPYKSSHFAFSRKAISTVDAA